MTGRHAVFRADASPAVGTGHVVRCRTLAEALIARGWHATMVSRDLPDGIAAGLATAGIALVALPAGTDQATEPAEIARQVDLGVGLVVGDGYGLDAGWFTAVRDALPGATIMAIDDLADRPLPVDLVLDQNLGAEEAAYAALVPAGTRILAGPAYALLRPEFAAARRSARPRDGRIERLLVFMSGADQADVTSRVVMALDGFSRPIDVVVGASYPHLAGLRALVAARADATLHVDTASMADLMERADLAIGGAGSANWERCALGLPAVLVTLAANQVAAARLLVEAGAAVSVGWHATVTPVAIETAVRALVADPAQVAAMSVAAAAVTDGGGTERVVREIEALVTNGSEAR